MLKILDRGFTACFFSLLQAKVTTGEKEAQLENLLGPALTGEQDLKSGRDKTHTR